MNSENQTPHPDPHIIHMNVDVFLLVQYFFPGTYGTGKFAEHIISIKLKDTS